MSYLRVIPRDLFNEAKLLKCLGQLALIIHDGVPFPRGLTFEHESPEDGFRIEQDSSSRFCTRMLKIEPYAAYLHHQGECTSYVGLRADEPEREGGDYLDIPGVVMDFPMRRWGWGIADVMGYLDKRGICIPKRTDCKLCFYQRLIEWWELWRDDPEGWAEGEAIEAEQGHTFRSPQRDTWPASMAGLRAEFEKGRVPKETRKDPLMCRVCRL